MHRVPAVRPGWLVDLVNEYGTQPRAVAGETDRPFPGLTGAPPAAAGLGPGELAAQADRWWPVFAEPSPERRTSLLNAELDAARLSPALTETGDLQWLTGHESPSQILAAGCASALLAAVTRFGWDRLGVCAGADCVDAYIDQQSRTRRIYCSPTCLNRARVRAYRARH